MEFQATLELHGKTATGLSVPPEVVTALRGRGSKQGKSSPSPWSMTRSHAPSKSQMTLRLPWRRPGATAAFNALSYTLRKEHVRQVESAKAQATRERRIAAILAGLSQR